MLHTITVGKNTVRAIYGNKKSLELRFTDIENIIITNNKKRSTQRVVLVGSENREIVFLNEKKIFNPLLEKLYAMTAKIRESN
jgi:hypothetical protein